MKLEAKHAEEKLDRLGWLIKNEFKKSLIEAEKSAKDKMSEGLQKRRMILADIEDVHTSCMALIEDFVKVINDNSRFIEAIRRDILLKGDKVPKEMFSDQAELFYEALKPLIERHENTVKDFYLRKKGE